MTTLHPHTASRGYQAAAGLLACPCPRCHGATYRVPRHFVDRLICVMVPMRRYHCWSIECGWEGLLRVRSGASGNAQRR